MRVTLACLILFSVVMSGLSCPSSRVSKSKSESAHHKISNILHEDIAKLIESDIGLMSLRDGGQSFMKAYKEAEFLLKSNTEESVDQSTRERRYESNPDAKGKPCIIKYMPELGELKITFSPEWYAEFNDLDVQDVNAVMTTICKSSPHYKEKYRKTFDDSGLTTYYCESRISGVSVSYIVKETLNDDEVLDIVIPSLVFELRIVKE